MKEIGEFGLIKKIPEWVHSGSKVLVDIGDDTAVIKQDKDSYLLFTTDMLIENIHFRLKQATPYFVGRKALAVNISDVAAMGGVPKYAVVALGISPDLKISFIRQIFKGIRGLADKFGVDIVGGDINRSNKLIISVSLVGKVKRNSLVLRTGARKGDAIFVTGELGGSYKSKKHLRFTPRVKEANFLTRNFKINSMIDISDGLASDLARILEMSKVGAILDERKIPISKNPSLANALFDGEDFELLFTTRESDVDKLLKKWPYALKLTRIGAITAAKKIIKLVTKNGTTRRITGKGFRHF